MINDFVWIQICYFKDMFPLKKKTVKNTALEDLTWTSFQRHETWVGLSLNDQKHDSTFGVSGLNLDFPLRLDLDWLSKTWVGPSPMTWDLDNP